MVHTAILGRRFDEDVATEPADLDQLNEHARLLFRDEVSGLVESLNLLIPADQAKLYVPDMKFDRQIGDAAQQAYSVTGERLSEDAYARHREAVLPTPADEAFLRDLMKNNDWILPKRGSSEA